MGGWGVVTVPTWRCEQLTSESSYINRSTESLVLVWGTCKGEFVYLSIFQTFSLHRTRCQKSVSEAASSYTFRFGDLPKLDLQVDWGSDFGARRIQWNLYVGLSIPPPTKQVQALMLCFSHTIVENLGLTTEQRKAIILAIKHYIDGHINESVEQHNFRRHVQQSGEVFDDFLVVLHELVKTCNFCSSVCMEKSIRDQIIEGILDGDTRASSTTAESNLGHSHTMCRAEEAAKKQNSDITLMIMLLPFESRNNQLLSLILRHVSVVEIDLIKEGITSIQPMTWPVTIARRSVIIQESATSNKQWAWSCST